MIRFRLGTVLTSDQHEELKKTGNLKSNIFNIKVKDNRTVMSISLGLDEMPPRSELIKFIEAVYSQDQELYAEALKEQTERINADIHLQMQ